MAGVNYVYCGCNGEQVLLAAGLREYKDINFVTVYASDEADTYNRERLAGLRGKTIMQHCAVTDGLHDVLDEMTYWVTDNSLNSKLTDINKYKDQHKFVTSSAPASLMLKETHGVSARQLERPGPVQLLRKKSIPISNTRIAIYGGYHSNSRLSELAHAVEAAGITKYTFYIEKKHVEAGIHNENILSEEQIHEQAPHTIVCDFHPLDVDMCICVKPYGESSINMALRHGIPAIAVASPYATTIEQKYNAVAIVRWDLTDMKHAINTANCVDVQKGRYRMQKIYQQDNILNVLEAPITTSKTSNRVNIKYTDINIFGLFRENEDTIGQTLSTLKAAERQSGYRGIYYLYENDSTDDTPNQIHDFYKHSPGNYKCDVLNTTKHLGIPSRARMYDLAMYRNDMKNLCDDFSTTKYSFIVDSEIFFDKHIIQQMIDRMEAEPDCVMVTPYGTPEFNNTYYDVHAYRDIDGGDTLPSLDDVTSVQSAFSGFVCIRSDVFERCYWNTQGAICEHIHFCEMVREHGKIVVDPNITVKWRK